MPRSVAIWQTALCPLTPFHRSQTQPESCRSLGEADELAPARCERQEVVDCGHWPEPELIRCLTVELIRCAIMGAQTNSRLLERLVLRFKLCDDGMVVGRLAHGRSLAQSLELVTYRLHPIVDLLAKRLI